MDRGAWRAPVYSITESDTAEHATFKVFFAAAAWLSTTAHSFCPSYYELFSPPRFLQEDTPTGL